MLGCCLVSLHFLCYILCSRSVLSLDTEGVEMMYVYIINLERKAEEKERPIWTAITVEKPANIL